MNGQIGSRKPRSLQWWLSGSLLLFGLMLTLGLTAQGLFSQQFIDHRIWRSLLESTTAIYMQSPSQAPPESGVLRGWRIDSDQVPADMPAYLARLAPGFYSESDLDTKDSYSVLVTALRPEVPGDHRAERLVMLIDITAMENEQNLGSVLAVVFGLSNLAMIGGVIYWVYLSLTVPVRDLARRMRALEPQSVGQRLPTDYKQTEMQTIAMASNSYLERVEQFIERERSLLDQASHEFRTPIAVIAGAVDVLRAQSLPPTAEAPLQRISETVDNLTQIMVALLYLSRERQAADAVDEITRLDVLVADLVEDHRYLLYDKPVELRLLGNERVEIKVPDAVARIAISNLLRNAAENTPAGTIEVEARGGLIIITDSGTGVDEQELARRYRASLHEPARLGRGLGLFLIRRICERFNWTLQMESVLPHGTRARLDVSASVVAAIGS